MAQAMTAPVSEQPARGVRWDARRAGVMRPRVLIVEDEPEMRVFIDRVLRHAGYSTARVCDGQEALEFAEQFGPFDLLLTDLVMPRMGGYELAQHMRLTTPELKVLYFTGYPDQLFEQKGRLWCDEACLEKPSSIEGLLEAVSDLLGGSTN